MPKRHRFRHPHILLSSLLLLFLSRLIPLVWAPLPDTDEEANSKIPPNIYKWIEENAHICTIVPSNGEDLVNFLSVEEGIKCVLCPELKPREVPTAACAVEVSSNDVNGDIGCHSIPELCVLELRNRYAEFYMGWPPGPEGPPGGLPPGPPGSAGNRPGQGGGKRSEEEIFQATDNVFTETPQKLVGVTEISVFVDEEEEQEEQTETEQRRAEEVKEVLDIVHGRADTTSTASSTTISATMEMNSLTTVRASVFSMPSGPMGVPLNLTDPTDRSLQHSRTAAPVLVPPGPPGGDELPLPLELDGNAIGDPSAIGSMQKRVKGGAMVGDELEEADQKSSEASCKDNHELCCFWAMAGECESNPFWMRVKCARTCGTCGCRVKNADKCKSAGVKCVLPSTSTTTTEASSTSTSPTTPEETTTLATSKPSPGPTPPPGGRRRTRPTPPARMPGHRPQRPKHQRTSPAISSSTPPQKMVAMTQVPLVAGDWSAVDEEGLTRKTATDGYEEEGESVGPPAIGDGSPPGSSSSPAEEEPPLFVMLSLNSAGLGDDEEKQQQDGKEVTTEAAEADEDASDAFDQIATIPVELASSESAPMRSTEASTTPSSSTTRDTCFNYHKLCEFWAKMGECTSNPFWMRPHCQRACQSCGETLGDISTPQPRPGGCTNEHLLCPFWAFIGECGRNPRWMGLHCRASCMLC